MSTTYQLREPITVTLAGAAGESHDTIASLSIRKAKAKDMRAVDPVIGDVAKSIALMARLTGQPVAVIDEMDVVDFQAIGEIIEGFTQPGLPTGQRS